MRGDLEQTAAAIPVEGDSRTFLVELFGGLRDDLTEQMREGEPRPDPKKAARHLAIYDALLDALEGREPFPDDKEVRQYVASLARATDDANGYEQAALEHRALTALVVALAAAEEANPGRPCASGPARGSSREGGCGAGA